MLIRLYNLLVVAGVFCLIVAGAALLATPTATLARPLLGLTPTAPPPPTPEPTDPPTATPSRPTATPPPTAGPPTATADPPTATPGAPTATPRPHRHSDPEPEPSATPTSEPSATPAPEPHIEVSLHKTVDHDTRTPGQTASYTLVGRNAGPATAYDVVIGDDLPPAVEVIDLSSSKGDVVVRGQRVTAYPSVLAPGESVTVTISVRVRAGAQPGAVINTGTITTSSRDDPGDNASSATFTIPNLSLTVQKLPRTNEVDLPGLLSLPVWLPWSLVGGLLTMLGIVLRLRGGRQAVEQPLAAAPAVSRLRSTIFRLPPPAPVGPPRLGPELPPPAPPAPLPPLTPLDREDALSDAIEE